MARAFGERVRSLRIAADLSEGELAARCGVSRPMLAKTEVGSTEPRLSLILTLCDGLGVSPDGLMAGLLAASSASGAIEARIQAKLVSLTPRETEVFEGVSRAESNAEIAFDLQISPETVHTHVANIRSKLGVRSKRDLVGLADLNGALGERRGQRS
jgi:DNA-binding CsgD family transcriptional regulator/DNA-binding Xre family transcriptional regulator